MTDKSFKLKTKQIMEQTAISWLGHELNTKLFYNIDPKLWDEVNEIFKQALEKEKEQIAQSYSHGWHHGQDIIMDKIKNIGYTAKGGDEAGLNYYSETYK